MIGRLWEDDHGRTMSQTAWLKRLHLCYALCGNGVKSACLRVVVSPSTTMKNLYEPSFCHAFGTRLSPLSIRSANEPSGITLHICEPSHPEK